MTLLEKAQRVLSLIHYRQDAIDRIVVSVANTYPTDDQLSDTDLEQKTLLTQTIREVAESSIDKALLTVARVYTEYYTEDELERMIELYESPLGKKILSESEQTFKDIETVMADWGNQLWNVTRVRMGWV